MQEPGRVYFLTWRCRPGITLSTVERTLVLNALRLWDGVKWKVYTAVVLSDHVHALAQPLPHPQGGMFLWGILPEGMDAAEVLKIAIEKKVAFVHGFAFNPNGGGENTMRLNFSFSKPDVIREGITRLGLTNAHVLRRYLGSPTPPQADFRIRLSPDDDDEQAFSNQGTTLLPGDRLLLCSDGLTDLVEAHEILAKLQANNREEALIQLTDLANQRGGHDNITLVLLEVPQKPAESEQLPTATPHVKPRSRRKFAIYCLGAAFLLLIGASLSLGLAWVLTHPKTTSTPTPSLVPTSAPPEATASQVPEAEIDKATVTTSPLPTLSTPQLTSQPTGTASPSPGSPTETYTPWPTNTTNPNQSTASPEAFLR